MSTTNGPRPFLGPIFFFFRQFMVKIVKNNSFRPSLEVGVPSIEKSCMRHLLLTTPCTECCLYRVSLILVNKSGQERTIVLATFFFFSTPCWCLFFCFVFSVRHVDVSLHPGWDRSRSALCLVQRRRCKSLHLPCRNICQILLVLSPCRNISFLLTLTSSFTLQNQLSLCRKIYQGSLVYSPCRSIHQFWLLHLSPLTLQGYISILTGSFTPKEHLSILTGSFTLQEHLSILTSLFTLQEHPSILTGSSINSHSAGASINSHWFIHPAGTSINSHSVGKSINSD